MDAIKFLKEHRRMCNSMYEQYNDSACDICKLKDNCPYDDINREYKYNELVEAVESWSLINPAKTRQREFLETFPNAKFIPNTHILNICPVDINVRFEKCGCSENCNACKEKYWQEVIE